ncbi:PREDICTED: transcriptional activator Myb [Nicotiana attenuata]|uniref:Transcription factor myb98 n=1 Tax=Nicotiana attenuata TaxID=49451 RepID=A0A1J6INM8_NICAT|nr:PREDICTED: transcriptional activator Myb [Nicotiana attenuata]XP_019252041.1 PREDICTED: transcriptional activator Myb [Nicotiana attenuata]XP_019252043.1 PREDICTED: transcriptional activator Myb [Nicotiana attenuata]OIS99326.1 transcription factor myb98 [Nicotiana attenuata]
MQQNMKKSSSSCEAAKPKERHIVSWSQEEDDILREQIRIHGTDNWTIIASKFKDKTTRQCRRRWFTYLNSDFKKGGWSPEEDMLLCEAQKIFGNRWTEIAKVVSGRTDNAVKNRFTTLCKKRAKHEALAKENSNSFVNLNNKRVIFPDGLNFDNITEAAAPFKKLRMSHISDARQNCDSGEKSFGDCGTTHPLLRHPFAVLAQNFRNAGKNLASHQQTTENDNKTQGTFLKKDDPKVQALMQQAELLSSLAMKVNTENTDQSLENAWKILQDFLHQTKEGEMLKFQIPEMNLGPDDYKDLIADSKSSNEGSRPSWRQPALSEDSAGSSEYSTGSTLLSHALADKTEESQAEVCAHHQDIESELRTSQMSDLDTLPVCGEEKVNDGPATATAECEFLDTDFTSPLQVTPLFRSLAAEIPTPKFSESERQFLLKTLGVESTSPYPGTNHTQPPSCKRALLHSL